MQAQTFAPLEGAQKPEALTRPLYTISESADALRCSRRMVYKLIESGRLKTARLGPASQRITGSTLRAVAEGRR